MNSCGNIYNISESCDDPSYSLVCEGNTTVLYLYYGRHKVHVITPTNSSTLRSVSAGVENNGCPNIASNSISYTNFTDDFLDKLRNDTFFYSPDAITFVSCKNPALVGIAQPCTAGYNSSTRKYTYVLFQYAEVSEVADYCSVDMMVNVWSSGLPSTCNENCSYPENRSEMVNGIELRWQSNRCVDWQKQGERCFLDNTTNTMLCPPLSKFSYIINGLGTSSYPLLTTGAVGMTLAEIGFTSFKAIDSPMIWSKTFCFLSVHVCFNVNVLSGT
ncbi:hypothetical protein L6164_036842 [Bauhinia variegata]|uniref:Uncharacterized protein n=1 Tax=Bauhinia variegata TaxID=167791 RepID=A0ACB9KIB1_BAUVA|nr:hypothetical protein L6164_036842 [Bauhinia variegata]